MTEKEAIETLQELSLERCEAFGFDCGNCDKCEVTIAYDMAIKALEKQIPKKHFKNECECIVDYEMLYTAINNKCKSKNCYCHNEYRIVLRNNYPTVCINRKRYYVHILIGEFIYGRIRKGYVIHHKEDRKSVV